MSKCVVEAPFYNRQLAVVIHVENTSRHRRHSKWSSDVVSTYHFMKICKINKLRGLSPQANYEGCRLVSTADPLRP
jgi:hypothetical protein